MWEFTHLLISCEYWFVTTVDDNAQVRCIIGIRCIINDFASHQPVWNSFFWKSLFLRNPLRCQRKVSVPRFLLQINPLAPISSVWRWHLRPDAFMSVVREMYLSVFLAWAASILPGTCQLNQVTVLAEVLLSTRPRSGRWAVTMTKPIQIAPATYFTDLFVILSNKGICMTRQKAGGEVGSAHFSKIPDDSCDQTCTNSRNTGIPPGVLSFQVNFVNKFTWWKTSFYCCSGQ